MFPTDKTVRNRRTGTAHGLWSVKRTESSPRQVSGFAQACSTPRPNTESSALTDRQSVSAEVGAELSHKHASPVAHSA
jgi:hypothetical protein